MSHKNTDFNLLKSLPCFGQVIDISVLENGLSHSCFKVATASKIFFAKKLNSCTSRPEVSCTCFSAGLSLSPAVIYHDNNWLVQTFIEGNALNKLNLGHDEQLVIAISLMAKLHQLSPQQHIVDAPILNVKSSIQNFLAKSDTLSALQRTSINKIADCLNSKINTLLCLTERSNVLCHGDINYSNILISKNHKPLLIDYECAQFAANEFDIGMFMAINNIESDLLADILQHYSDKNNNSVINPDLVISYMLYSFLINALWYFDKSNDAKPKAQFHALGTQQCLSFDRLSSQYSTGVPRLLAVFG